MPDDFGASDFGDSEAAVARPGRSEDEAAEEEDAETTTAPAKHWPSPSMFCFMFILSQAEIELTKMLAQKRYSIFSCDEHSVYSRQFVDLGGGETTAKPLVQIIGDPAPACKTTEHTVCNARIFVQVWVAVSRDGKYKNHDWTVKVDSDSVFFPDRLRHVLQGHPTGVPAAVMSMGCWLDKIWFLGPLEIVSRELLQAYMRNPKVCTERVDFDLGEDKWMEKCFTSLNIGFHKIDGTWMVSDNSHFPGIPPDPCAYEACDGEHKKIVYHHYKTPSDWETCHNKANHHFD